ncbi:MAG TPA: hypothetical protein VFC98_05080 [Clostridia bacterium]|nr:hypothetical protein [Clostridia bacterium]
MTVKIDIKRTGFPVKIGDLELFFDSSIENLRRFFDIEEIAQKKLKEAQEKAKYIHFPEDITAESIKDMDVKNVDAALDLNKEFIAAQYDIIFGDGIFRKIYEKYPDVLALEEALEPLGIAIAERIEQQETERTERVEAKKKEYLTKKDKKN